MPPSHTRPWLLEFMVLSALWGSSFLFMRWGAQHFGAVPVVWLRVTIGMLVLLPLVRSPAQWAQAKTHWRAIALMGTLNSAIPFVFLGYAVMHMTTGLASILNAVTPLFGALVAWAWLKNKPGWSRCTGLALGFLGVAVLTLARSADPASAAEGSPLAMGLCLLATFFYGLAASLAQRHLSTISPMVTASGSMLAASLLLLLPTLWLWPTSPVPWQGWAAAAALGVFCTGLAYALYFRLNTRIGAVKAMAVTYLIPLFATLEGAVFFDERLSLITGVCALVIMLGTALATGVWRWPLRKTAA